MDLCRNSVLVFLLITMISFDGLGQKNLTRVAPGRWGGVGVELVVRKDSVAIEYDCGSGEIRGPLRIDKKGNFVGQGFHKRLYPGPIRLGLTPAAVPAKYEGKITGGSITYNVVLIGTGELIGEFVAQRGKPGHIRNCR